MRYLNRDAAGLEAEIWDRIDKTAVEAARDLITARRFLPVEGPFGLGLTSVEVGDDGYCREPQGGEAGAVMSRAISLPMLRRSFQLSLRRIEGFRQTNQPLHLAAAAEAAEAVARLEEEFIYYGRTDFGLSGLLTAGGRGHHQTGDWHSTEQALNDVLAAVNILDNAGFGGPYALALSAPLYNGLFRRYEGTEMLQVDHLRRLCELGVYKAPIIGGVMVDPRAGRLYIGQDLMAGYEGQDGIHYEFHLSESIALIVEQPGAICVLESPA